MMMYHDLLGNPDLLLRGEDLAILAAAKGRLELESLKRHAVIPVMISSLVGEQHGTILTTYFDGRHLVIQKSALYRFYSTDRALFDLFQRYMTADVNQGEDTIKL
ncbi:hypothetical protein BDW62DRAFT_204893 [Aspergillus aurantiobrunneus]